MIIAKQKKKENIAEYVLYMWQIEDMLRALDIDKDKVGKNLISKYETDTKQKQEIRNWYEGLIQQMKDEKIQNAGHLQFLINQVNDLYEFHLYLMQNESETTYQQVFNLALPNLAAFREKSKNKDDNDVELTFNALYSLLLLRLQNKEVTSDTEKAMTSFSNYLGLLSKKYQAFHAGEEDFNSPI
ncbi:MAG: DUF4924 family protein [Bacteroidota bacterium]|nr:DUF4924 family protein [Bacteroidota bacterium]